MMNFSIKQQESDILPGLYISGNKEPENKRTKQSVLDFISEVRFHFSSKINYNFSFPKSAFGLLSDVWCLGLLHNYHLWWVLK